MKAVFALVLLTLFLGACAAPGPAPAPSPSPVDTARLRRELTVLPGARVGEGDPPAVSYPGEVLFAEGAALPLAGGTALLDPLASFLAAHPEVRWRGVVRARTGAGDEGDRALAAKRAELLARYFTAKGIPAGRLELVPEAAEGPPLELAPAQSASDASSSRPNS